jgi:hypothetical protein
MRYVPDTGAQVAGYWLLAEPTTTTVGLGQIYYANASGVIYQMTNTAREDSLRAKHPVAPIPVPPADSTLLSIDDSPVWKLLQTRECLLRDSASGARRLPERLVGNRCISFGLNPRAGALTVDVAGAWQKSGPFGTYRVMYDPRRGVRDSSVVAFSMTARPMTYGVDGLRSYLVDDAGIVHWTSDDRDATMHDPVVSPCESGSGQNCRYFGSLEKLQKGN